MSRHRDVRSMNYSDEYDGYDDVYGHSVEDDYCVSPSVEQFLFDRSKQQNIASFITEPDIVEDNEDIDESPPPLLKEEKYNLSELERAKLISCLETIRNVIGDTVPENKLREKIILSNFDANVALDAVLKESSPKNVTDPATNKERLERHPGVSVDKPNASMFTIPKFSFKKEDNVPKDPTIFHLYNNLNDVKHSTVFSSLAGLISHHTESVHSNAAQISSRNNVNVQSFSSLAALTAHHLQNSNAVNNPELCEGRQSSNSQFVIPVLAVKKNNNEEVENRQLLNKSENDKKLIAIDNLKKYPIDLLQKNFSNMHILPESNILMDIKLEEQPKNTVSVIDEIPSPDNWIVDLSTALKEAELLTDGPFSNTNLIASKKCYNMPTLEMSIENSVIPNMLPITLNLCALRHVKLPYTKKKVSIFGRTLCRKWKTRRKPVLKILVQCYNTIKPFDFSTPYRNTNRS